MSQPDEAQPIQDFFQWAQRECKYPELDPGRHERIALNLITPIKAYFEENKYEKLNAILAALFKPEDPPDLAEVIVQNYTAAFSILLHIGKGKFIEVFVEHNSLDDGHLPFDPSNKPAYFPNSSDKFLFQQFCQYQWRFCCPILSRNRLYNEHFHQEQVLPIAKKEQLGIGGSAILYKIQIYDEYNKLLPEHIKNKLSPEYANTFVLKTYMSKDADKNHKNEVAAFKRLKNAPHIIGYYGSYKHGATNNILLEYADKGDLERFFMEVEPPNNGEDILKFWKGIFNVLIALMAIHAVRPQGDPNAPPIFQGLHQDVKPQNILIISNEQKSPHSWQFKLGDLGLSQFEKLASLKNTTAIDAQGTRTYGAPECYRADEVLAAANLPVTPGADIWSLGCIYSEAARWVATGKRGLLAYRQARLSETQQIPNFEDGNCFHDGQDILKAVRGSRETTISSLHQEDTITRQVLERMVDEMLQPEPDTRPTAKQLWAKVVKILVNAEAGLSNLPTHSPAGEGSKSRPPPLPPPPPPVLPPSMTPDYYYANPSHEQSLNRLSLSHVQSLPTEISKLGLSASDEELSHHPDGFENAEEYLRLHQSDVSGKSIPQVLPTLLKSPGGSMFDGGKQKRRRTFSDTRNEDGSARPRKPSIKDHLKSLSLTHGGRVSPFTINQVIQKPDDLWTPGTSKLTSKKVSPQEPSVNLSLSAPEDSLNYTITHNVVECTSGDGSLRDLEKGLDSRRKTSLNYNRKFGDLSEKLAEYVSRWCQGTSHTESTRSGSIDPVRATYVLGCPKIHPISYTELRRIIEHDRRHTGLKDLTSNEPEFEVDIRCPTCGTNSRTRVKWARQIEPLLFILAEMEKESGIRSHDRPITLPRTLLTEEALAIDPSSLTTSSSNSTNISSSSFHVDTSSGLPIASNDTVHDRKHWADNPQKQKLNIKTRPSYYFSADGRSLLLWARDADHVIIYDIASALSQALAVTNVHLAAGGANIFATVSKQGNRENLRIYHITYAALLASTLLDGLITSIALSCNDEFVALGNASMALVYKTSNTQLLWRHKVAPFSDLKLKHQRVWFSTNSEKLIVATRNMDGDVYIYVSNCNQPIINRTTPHINIPTGLHKDFGVSAILCDNKSSYAFVATFNSAAPPALFSLHNTPDAVPKVERLDRIDLGTQIQCATIIPNATQPEFVLVNGENYIFSVQGLRGSPWELTKKWRLPGGPVFTREEMTVIAMPTHSTIYAFRIKGKERNLTMINGDKISTSDISNSLAF